MSLTGTYSNQRLTVARLARQPIAQAGSLKAFVDRYATDSGQPVWHSDWAWDNFESLTLALASQFQLRQLLEIGGGRDPGFLGIGQAAGLEVIVNDIDAGELARLPPGTPTAQFDIAGDLSGRPDLREAFDLMSARMVFEHIPDVRAAWRNVHRLLRPGGIGLAFFPTLYAWPFLLNRMLPAQVAKQIVERFFPSRAEDGTNPVFPAHYDWCVGSEKKLRTMLEPIGFSEIVVQPFWGHHYLDRVPVLRTVDALANRACAALDWRLFTTYAVVMVRK